MKLYPVKVHENVFKFHSVFPGISISCLMFLIANVYAVLNLLQFFICIVEWSSILLVLRLKSLICVTGKVNAWLRENGECMYYLILKWCPAFMLAWMDILGIVLSAVEMSACINQK